MVAGVGRVNRRGRPGALRCRADLGQREGSAAFWATLFGQEKQAVAASGAIRLALVFGKTAGQQLPDDAMDALVRQDGSFAERGNEQENAGSVRDIHAVERLVTTDPFGAP